MNIGRVNSSKITNLYSNNNSNQNNKKVNKKDGDTIQISSLGKTLSNYATEDIISSQKRMEKIREEIQNGTYKNNSRLIADKLFQYMKGREI